VASGGIAEAAGVDIVYCEAYGGGS
jgi:hypothetical protein